MLKKDGINEELLGDLEQQEDSSFDFVQSFKKPVLQAPQVESVLRELSNGRIFSVKFIKRTTGELRTMVCRFGVHKDLTENSKGRSYEPNNKGLVPVYDVQKQGYRMISVEGIQEIKVDGETYTF